jgi:EmrB/QacA subfamily drug resistance transporter
MRDPSTPSVSLPPAAIPRPLAVGGWRLICVMVGIELGMLLAAMDQTIVGTAMPHILADLHGFAEYSWVATAYLLASTAMMPIYGKLSDMYGRRLFFVGGVTLFLVGSALCGTSQSMEQLIAYRALQGLGGGAIMPVVQAIVGGLFAPAERGKWQGLTVGIWGLASILGPWAGGWISDNWGWPWVFYINLPLGALAVLIAGLALPRMSQRQQHRIDYFGAAALIAATLLVLLAFSWAGSQYTWTSPTILGLLGGALGAIVVLIVVESHAAEPILSLRLFANGIFVVSLLTTFLVSSALLGSLYYLPLFFQGVMDQPATRFVVLVIPLMAGVMASSIVGGLILSRTRRYKLQAMIGLLVAALGMFLLSRMDVHTTFAELARNLLITGLGIGASTTLFTVIVQNAFSSRQIGQVTAALAFFRELGGTIGLAVLGSVMVNSFQDQFQRRLPAAVQQTLSPEQIAQLSHPEILLSPSAVTQLRGEFAAFGPAGDALAQQILNTLRMSLADAIARGFLFGAALLAVGFVATLALREIPLRTRHEANGHEQPGLS